MLSTQREIPLTTINFSSKTKIFEAFIASHISNGSIVVENAISRDEKNFRSELRSFDSKGKDPFTEYSKEHKFVVAFVNHLTDFTIFELRNNEDFDDFKELFLKEKFYDVKYLIISESLRGNLLKKLNELQINSDTPLHNLEN